MNEQRLVRRFVRTALGNLPWRERFYWRAALAFGSAVRWVKTVL